MGAAFWDERYGDTDQLFSGNPNGVLVEEVSDLTPGQALDVGCGEGADALWLARRGWRVTAVDISRVALQRAAAAGAGAGADVNGHVAWTRADLTSTPSPPGSFDLVSIQYFPLPRPQGLDALNALVDAVAHGGTLLVASHAIHDVATQPDAAFDPSDYYHPKDFARQLDDAWTILANETRPRSTPAPEGSGHTHDVVLRAERRRR